MLNDLYLPEEKRVEDISQRLHGSFFHKVQLFGSDEWQNVQFGGTRGSPGTNLNFPPNGPFLYFKVFFWPAFCDPKFLLLKFQDAGVLEKSDYPKLQGKKPCVHSYIPILLP
jgi:hypothetical protein